MERRHRAADTAHGQTFATLVGLELRPKRLREATLLWKRLTEERGVEGRDAIWEHPDLLPDAEALADPEGYVSGQFDLGDIDMSFFEEGGGAAEGGSGPTEGDDEGPARKRSRRRHGSALARPGNTARMNEEPVSPAAYVHRLGIDEIPEWLPALDSSVLDAADALDATRGDDGYGAASVEYAVDHPDARCHVVLWALLRYRLGQQDAARLLDASLLDGLRWPADVALWIGDSAPLTSHTAAVIVRALEALWIHELPLAAERVAELRRADLDAELAARVGRLHANIARATRLGSGLDPRFADRVAIPLRRPIHAVLFHCPRDKHGPPGLGWQWKLKEMAGREFGAVRAIVEAVPAHLEEHGKFSQGEDILRGLVWMAGHADEEWTVPLLASIVVAAAGTRPVLSQKLARTAVDALFLCTGAKETMRGLESRVRSEAIRKRIAGHVADMN